LSFIRNENKALISTDVAALNKYKAERKLLRRVADLEKRLATLEKILKEKET